MNKKVLVVAAGLAWMSASPAWAWVRVPAIGSFVEADWQSPEQLPWRFRNHCTYDSFSGRAYCSDHCGFDYQFYFCSPLSFGCCHLGFGYCDWTGLLRCHP